MFVSFHIMFTVSGKTIFCECMTRRVFDIRNKASVLFVLFDIFLEVFMWLSLCLVVLIDAY